MAQNFEIKHYDLFKNGECKVLQHGDLVIAITGRQTSATGNHQYSGTFNGESFHLLSRCQLQTRANRFLFGSVRAPRVTKDKDKGTIKVTLPQTEAELLELRLIKVYAKYRPLLESNIPDEQRKMIEGWQHDEVQEVTAQAHEDWAQREDDIAALKVAEEAHDELISSIRKAVSKNAWDEVISMAEDAKTSYANVSMLRGKIACE